MLLPPGWDLPPALFALLGERSSFERGGPGMPTVGRQRALVADDSLLLILHKVPEGASSRREAVAFWRTSGGEWRAPHGGAGIVALRSHLESYARAVADLEEEYEAAHDAAGVFHVIEKAAPLVRAATNAAGALNDAAQSLPEARELLPLREASFDTLRGAELLHADARTALDFQIARQSEEQARQAAASTRASNRVGTIAAFFLPLTALSGVFGMNLPTGLDASPALFWGIFGAGALFGAVLGLLLGRQK